MRIGIRKVSFDLHSCAKKTVEYEGKSPGRIHVPYSMSDSSNKRHKKAHFRLMVHYRLFPLACLKRIEYMKAIPSYTIVKL